MNKTINNNISQQFKKNKFQIINIIQSNRNNKLDNTLNNLLQDYHIEGSKINRKNKKKLSMNCVIGILKKNIQNKNKSISNEKVTHVISIKSDNHENDIRLSLNSDSNITNSYINNNNNSNNSNIYEEIIKEKDLQIFKLKNEIKINNQLLNIIKKKEFNLNDWDNFCSQNNKINSNNHPSKKLKKSIFIFSNLINHSKKNKIYTSRYKSGIIMENEKSLDVINKEENKYIKRNFSGFNSQKKRYFNSDTNLIYFNINNNIMEGLFYKSDFNYICSSIMKRTQNIFLKYKTFYNKKKLIK